MKIMFVSAEVAPFSKVGGLADVVGSLPKVLEKMGHEVAIFTPFLLVDTPVQRSKNGARGCYIYSFARVYRPAEIQYSRGAEL